MRALIAIILLLASVECHALGLNLSFDLGGGSSVRYEPIISTLSWSPTSKDFGSQNTGTNTDQTFTLTCQAGGGDCEEITNSVTGTGYSINTTTCATAPFTLTAGNGCNAVVRFSPASAGTLTGTLKAAWTNQSDVTAALTGVGVQADPYTTDFASDWSGTGVQDTSNPSGGVYSGWTTSSGNVANTGNELVVTQSASNTSSYVEKSGLTARQEIKQSFTIKPTTLSIGSFNTSFRALHNYSTSSNFGWLLFMSNGAGNLSSVRFDYYNGSASLVSSTQYSYTFVANTTYTIDLYLKASTDTSTADGYYRVDINGVEVIPSTAIITNVRNINKVQLGEPYVGASHTNTIKFDNFIMRYK